MPSPKSVLRDIVDFKLDPKKAHTKSSLGADGRIKKKLSQIEKKIEKAIVKEIKEVKAVLVEVVQKVEEKLGIKPVQSLPSPSVTPPVVAKIEPVKVEQPKPTVVPPSVTVVKVPAVETKESIIVEKSEQPVKSVEVSTTPVKSTT